MAKAAKTKEEVNKERAAYYREYRKKNPEKIKKIQERYWLKKAEELKKAGRGE